MNNRGFKAFLSFNWHWYLVILLLVLGVYYYIFTILRTPTYDERITVFVGVNYIEKQELESDLFEGFEETEIREIFVDFSDPTDDDFAIIFNTRATVNTDVLILPKDFIKNENYQTFFASFSEEYISFEGDYIKDDNDKIYGINVTKFIRNYTDSKDEYYLFFNKKSNKIGELNDISSNRYAIDILDNFN